MSSDHYKRDIDNHSN